VPESQEDPFDSATISSSITPQVWDVVMKATAPAMDDRQLKLERTKRKRKLMKQRIEREQHVNRMAGALNESVAKVLVRRLASGSDDILTTCA